GRLKNDTPGTLELIGYSVLSEDTALLSDDGDWSSLEDQAYGGWEEAAPSSTALNELNGGSSLSLAAGEFAYLGRLFDIAYPMTGVSLEFARASAINFESGV